MLTYSFGIPCPKGLVTITGNEHFIIRVELRDELKWNKTDSLPPLLEKVKGLIKSYLNGEKISFQDIPLLLPENIAFFLEEVRKIPYGEVTTYKEVAKRTGIHPRTAGVFLSKNPLPIIIPCHRVILSNGKLGGFSSGEDWKRFLLKIEGISVL